MARTSVETHTARSAEDRARDVVGRIVSQAEAIPVQQGGGHKLDMQLVYEEVVAALRETIDDLAFCTERKTN